jgi:hypothetical protein
MDGGAALAREFARVQDVGFVPVVEARRCHGCHPGDDFHPTATAGSYRATRARGINPGFGVSNCSMGGAERGGLARGLERQGYRHDEVSFE